MTRLVVLYWGREGTGKSFYTLSFPKPISFHDFDLNTEHLEKHFKDVRHHRYAPPRPQMKVEEAAKILDGFYENIERDYAETATQTIVIDTLTSFNQIVTKVGLDAIEQKRGFLREEKSGRYLVDSQGERIPNPAFQVYPMDYAQRNEILKNTLNFAKGRAEINIVATAQAKEVYDARGRPTGVYAEQVPEMTTYLVQVILHTLLTEGIFMAEVEKWSFNMGRKGDVLDDPTYAGISKLVAKDVS